MDDIDRFLDEDLDDRGDITSNALFTDEEADAVIIVKDTCVLAGMQEAALIFQRTGSTVKTSVSDGTWIKTSTKIAEISGPVRSILKGERLALNFLGRMSAIATSTKTMVDRCKSLNPNIEIAATRKTTPGFRFYEKKAVQIGGGFPHRFGLFDAVMIKDNHLKCIGSVETAIRRAKAFVKDVIIEIEVEHEKDAILAASLDVDVIMLDNISHEIGEHIAQKIREINPNITIEVSGGITPENVEEYASFADRISLGYLTHTIENKDFSLEIVR
jgi:nicotinate-nucleotide pyrophosphorylase (carboxylating)